MERVARFAVNSSSWQVVAIDPVYNGTVYGYATIALARADGKVIFPNIDPVQASEIDLKSISSLSTLADGSAFEFALDRTDADFGSLADDATRSKQARVCSGTGQTFVFPGVSPVSLSPIQSVWLRKTVTAGDIIILGVRF